MIKIIHILAHNIEDFISGDEENFDHRSVRFLEEIKKFSEKPLEQELWALTKGEKREFRHQKGFKVKLFPVSIKLPFPLEFSFSLLGEIIKWNKNKKPIWNLFSYYLFMYDFIAPILRLKKQKFLIHYWGGGPSFTPKALFYTIYHYLIVLRITLNLASFVFIQNRDEEKRVKKFLRLKERKVIYFPNTIEQKLLPLELKKPEEKVKVVIAGRLSKMKQSKKVLKILEELIKKNNLSLKVIGLKKKDETFSALKTKFPEKVELFPWLTKGKLLKEFRESDIYLHLNTKNEGCPMTMVEAMSQGVVPISFNIEGVRELIKNGKNGYLIENARELKEKVDYLSRKRETLNKLKENSLAIIRKNFLSKYYIPIFIKIINQLKNNHSGIIMAK